MGLLLPLPTSVVLTSQDKMTQGEWTKSDSNSNSFSMLMSIEEKKERKPRLNSNSFLIRSKRKRKVQSTSTSKRIRGLWDTTEMLSSHFILCVMWFAFAVHLICDNNLFSLQAVDARPYHSSTLCTAIITIPRLHTGTVGLQNFGKSLREDVDSSYSYLTILPGFLNGLCSMPSYEGYNYESSQFPPGDIAVMVDMNEGGCDLLTKASNALTLQKYVTNELKFVIFYSSSETPSTSLPELNLDATMPPTSKPTKIPYTTDFPTFYPTYYPTMSSPPTTGGPSGEPSLSTSPSVSTAPTGKPSMSMEPSTSESPTTTSSPTGYPTTQKPSTQSPTTQQPSKTTSTQYPTKSGVTMEPSDMPEAYPTTQWPTTQSPTKSDGTSETTEVEGDALLIRSLSAAYDPFLEAIDSDKRARQKQELYDNDSMVFLSMSQFDAYTINLEIDGLENSDKTPVFLMEGNQNWDMKMFLNPTKSSGESPSCYSSPTYTTPPTYPTPAFVPDPTPFPSRYVPKDVRQPSKSYQDRTPFTIFKFVLFGLLIASPCLRLIHQWWAGGGRIRLRRSEDGDSNRVVGLQYIPPMDNWYGGPLETNEAPSPPDRLTVQQIMSLPEIRYTKPIHHDDKINDTKTIEESDDSLENSSNHLYNEADDIDDNNQGDGSTEIIGTPGDTRASTDGEEMERDASIGSEASFENEPSVRLELPTSPPRVTSTSVSQSTNPLSPRAIVQTEEVPPDEERPEEQEEPDPQDLQQPTLVSPPPTPLPTLSPTTATSSTPVSPLVQRTSHSVTSPQQSPRPVSPLPQEQSSQQCLRESEIAPLSFRTQRRLQSFTTTTCTTCSICIDEFEVGETIRLLPRCGHAFHTDCILPWLQDRQGCCPLCKTEVLDRASEESTNNNENNNELRAERRSSF